MSEDRGIASMSLREVAKEAGIAAPSFYRHFENLEELGLTLVKEAGGALLKVVRDARHARGESDDVVRRAVEVCMEHFQENGRLFRLLAHELTGSSPRMRRAIQQQLASINAELSRAIKRQNRLLHRQLTDTTMVAEAISTITFYMGVASIDLPYAARRETEKRLMHHIRAILIGAETMARTQHVERQLLLV
ncbi:Transcriptional regulator [gamma proteobacterium HdN1]|nr:Transcriptional regulator [gamma proteobacterium HdN1]